MKRTPDARSRAPRGGQAQFAPKTAQIEPVPGDFGTASSRSGRRRFCRGLSTLDLLVALTLLVAAMSVATPLLVRYGRVMSSHRHYRLALDELSNQLERLRAMPAHDVPSAIERLTPSSFIKERLPGAELKGQVRSAAGGSRVTLSLSWNEGERHRAPVSLAAWVFSTSPAKNATTEDGMP